MILEATLMGGFFLPSGVLVRCRPKNLGKASRGVVLGFPDLLQPAMPMRLIAEVSGGVPFSVS